MATFKDKNAKAWQINLDGPTIARIRAETCGISGCKHRPLSAAGCEGVDLADLSGKTFERLDEDVVLLVDVLWHLCSAQAEAASITDADFGRSLGGDALAEASIALVRACCEFLPPTKRQYLERVQAKRLRIAELALQRGIAKIEDPETESRLLANLDERLESNLQDRLTQLNSA